MRMLFSNLSVCLLIGVMGTSEVSAQNKRILYEGQWHNVPCSVTIDWSNYSGLGPVSGQIFITGDKVYSFTGNNSVSGRLDLTVPGDPPYQFQRINVGGNTTWSLVPGGGVTFSKKAAGSGLPGSGNNPGSGLPGSGGGLPGGLPGGGKPDPKTTLSTGTWGPSPISITIHWDNYSGQGPVAGSIDYNGSTYPFAGTNPRKGYMEIKITGVNGIYRLNKSGTGASSLWSGSLNGSLLSFSRAGVNSPNIGGNNIQNTTWLIACEADRKKAGAERAAAAWRNRGFGGACVVHKSQYNSLTGDQNWWVACAGQGSRNAMTNLLPQVKRYFPTAYGIKADQSSTRQTFQ